MDLLHLPREKEDVNIVLQLPLASRSHPEELLALRVRAGDVNDLPELPASASPPLPSARVGARQETVADKSIYHKNLMPVIYVIADVAGAEESPVYAHPEAEQALKLDPPLGATADSDYDAPAVLDGAPVNEVGRRMAHHL